MSDNPRRFSSEDSIEETRRKKMEEFRRSADHAAIRGEVSSDGYEKPTDYSAFEPTDSDMEDEAPRQRRRRTREINSYSDSDTKKRIERDSKKQLKQQKKEEKSKPKSKPWLSIRGHKVFSEKKEKTYGKVLSDAIRGASLGLMAGTGALQLSGVNKTGSTRAKAMIPLAGAALGAVAGSLWGIVKTADQVISQHGTGHKLIEEVVKNLKRAGYKRDTDWTMDPKRATTMKTKVCIVLSRTADELGVLVNMANDPKLKSVSAEITKNLPVDAQETEKFSDRFNDLQISSYPSSKDSVFVFSIVESFIKRGFPVYLLEVG